MAQFQGRKSKQRFVLISILFFHSMNTYMDRACIASATNEIMRDLSITKEMLGLILGIFAVGYALFQVPSGWIADRFGPRKALTIVVAVWSCFTALTGAARNALQMLVLRFLFGVGEAGAFPGAAQAFYRWLPAKERGLAHGINFSGSRLGAAFSLFLMPWLIYHIGWRLTFVVNGVIGIIWAIVWLTWFRDNPRDNKKVNAAELDYIESSNIQAMKDSVKASFAEVFTSLNMSLAMLQYFASNVTFFICLTWLPSYIRNRWPDDPNAIYYSAVPLIFAAFAQWIAGSMVTILYNRGFHLGSRRFTAMLGFGLGVIGLILAACTDNLAFLTTDQAQLYWFVICFAVATFGVDMTLSPSWTFCNDIGGANSGAVSASMNMVGNIGAALSAIAFPMFANANHFFLMAAGINLAAMVIWCFMNPNRVSDKELSPAQIRTRFIAMITALFVVTLGAVSFKIYKSTHKKPGDTATQQVDPNAVPDANQILDGEPNE
ncbi:MAG: MFS transporter [Phycisphaeraceae bacterium]|nr:MFS transporter [Phycisphaeraceae bacterium]